MARRSRGLVSRWLPTVVGLVFLVGLVVVVARVMGPESDATATAPPAGDPRPEGSAASDAFGVTTTSSPLPSGCETVVVSPPGAAEEFLGDLCVPDGTVRDTTIVLVHGGGGFGGERSDLRAWSEAYREAGYPTLSTDYLIFDETTRSPVYPEPEQDVKAAVQWVRANGAEHGVPSERVVVHGISAGARLGGQLEVTPDDPYYQDTELWPGTSDAIDGFIGFYGYYSGLQFDEERYYGGPEDSPDALVRGRWERADSVAMAQGAVAPVLLVHGDEDGLVAVEQTERFGAALEANGVDVTVRVLPGEGHAFDLEDDGSLSPTGEALVPEILTWLDGRVA
ncbi:MAG TPA: alpha/beta hydrolase [Acidimicrobiales bacterium]|nr:alpha/beta hydrolase [Acidimicrobiales bacterium]